VSLRFISYGGGVQSTALLVLAATRDPRFEDVMGGQVTDAVFANVGDDSEHPDAMRWIRDIATPWAAERGVTVHEVAKARRDGSTETLFEEALRTNTPAIPVRAANGAPGARSCTANYKIAPIAKWAKARGASPDDRATVAIGISTDEFERAGRRRDIPHEVAVYPLLDLGMSRNDCQRLNVATFGAEAPKSSCWFCPFHTPAVWAEMRRDEPALFEQSVQLERAINRRRAETTCHAQGVPSVNVEQVPEVEGSDVPLLDVLANWRGTCPECGRTRRLDGPGALMPPHAADPVWLTRFARPLDEAVGVKGDTLPGFEHSIGETGCDEGACFT